MSNRKKPTTLFPIKDLDGADETLAEIAGRQREVDSIEADMNREIDRIKSEAKAKAVPHVEKMKALINSLQAFCEYRKPDLFKKRRSIPLTHGIIGFRKTTSLKPMPKNTWAKVLEHIKKLKFKTAVRVKEEPNKEVLSEWSDDKLAKVKARRVVKDQFWYETKEEEISPGEWALCSHSSR